MSKAKQILEDFAKNPTTTTLETMETLVAYAHGLELLIDENAPTLRDQFAMAAMQALLSNPEYSISRDDAAKYGSGDAVTAHYAYSQADAMLEARKAK